MCIRDRACSVLLHDIADVVSDTTTKQSAVRVLCLSLIHISFSVSLLWFSKVRKNIHTNQGREAKKIEKGSKGRKKS